MTPAPDPPVAEKEQLLLRCHLTIDALEQAEPSPVWAQLRATVAASATRLADLRSLVAELKPMAAMLPRDVRQTLTWDLESHGIDIASERRRDAVAIAAVRARGRIRSEAEFRRVQVYADTLVEPDDQPEYQKLAALLDEFMSRGARPSGA